MTKRERMKAFELRLEGKSWTRIAEALDYTPATVKEDLLSCITARPRQVNCVFPAIRKIIAEEYGGSVRAFAEDCGISHTAMYYFLSGRRSTTATRKARICAVLNLSPGAAFRREDL